MTKKAKNAQVARKRQSARALERKVTHAVNHPVRLDSLAILIERVASPKEIAKMLKVPLGTASFHIGELADDDVIELVKTEQRRGALEHYYRAKVKPEISDNEWRAMPKASRRKIAALSLQAIVAEGLASLRHGKMDIDDELNLVWKVVRVNAEGQREISALQAEMLDRLEAIRVRSEVHSPAGEDAEPARVAAMMWFERSGLGGQAVEGGLDLSELEK